MNPKISVIIPTNNRTLQLKRCLESLLRQTLPLKDFEIIVIAEPSSDKSADLLEGFLEKNKNIVYIQNKSHQGPSQNRNRGIKKARGNIIAFTDDDCIAQKDWLEKILYFHRKFPDGWGIGGSIFGMHNDLITRFRIFQFYWTLRWNNVGGNYQLWLPTLNVSYKKEAFERCGFFDKNLLASEDVEFNLRLFKKGTPIRYCKEIRIFHDYSSSFGYFLGKSYQYGLYIPLIKKKHPPLRAMVPSGIGSGLMFIVGFIASPLVKIASISKFHDLTLIPLIAIDDFMYRLGVLHGLLKKAFRIA